MKTSVLEFRLFDDIFCFNTKDIEYVFELEEYEDVKGFHSSVVGIAKYNNDVMLLIDTAKLYSDKFLDLSSEKSVIVIRDDENRHYGMIVDEIIKLEEIETVQLSIDLNSEDMIINHYKDKEADDIVCEIYPLPLFKKYDIPAMASSVVQSIAKKSEQSTQNRGSYLLFTSNEHAYAIDAKTVKEILEKGSELFTLHSEESELIKGAMAVRDEVIPIVEIEHSQKSNDIIVVEVSGKKLGIEVDEVYDIENFVLSAIEEVESAHSNIAAFYNHNGEVVGIINPHYFMKKIEIHKDDDANLSNKPLQTKKYDYLIFLMDETKYSIDMSCVRQVIETEDLAKTQSSSIVANDTVAFIATWNHRAVNVLKLDKKLGIESKKENTQSIFIEHNGHVVAFMVHDIDNIVYLNEEDITEASATKESLVNGAIVYNDEVIVKLNEKYIVSLD